MNHRVQVSWGNDSLPALWSYNPPTITSVFPRQSTAGGDIVTITGFGFGFPSVNPLPIVKFDERNCTIVTSNNTIICCYIPMGRGSAAIVRVIAMDQIGTTSYSYASPVITHVSGCSPSLVNNGTIDCPTTGGVRITIQGSNFGNDTTVTRPVIVKLGGLLCTNVVMESPHTKLSCIMPAGSGYGVAVLVDVDGQTASADLLSYASNSASSQFRMMSKTLLVLRSAHLCEYIETHKWSIEFHW